MCERGVSELRMPTGLMTRFKEKIKAQIYTIVLYAIFNHKSLAANTPNAPTRRVSLEAGWPSFNEFAAPVDVDLALVADEALELVDSPLVELVGVDVAPTDNADEDAAAVPVWVAPPTLVALEVVKGASAGIHKPLILVRSW